MTEKTIVMKGRGHHEEGVLDTAAYPGMHISLAADGKFDPSPETAAELAKGVAGLKIVKEDALQGRTVATQYAIGDRVMYYQPVHGDHIGLLVKSGENIAVGDTLIREGGGSGLFVEAAGTETSYVAEALESSGGALAANTLIKCRILRP